jgi:hypothetical protein
MQTDTCHTEITQLEYLIHSMIMHPNIAFLEQFLSRKCTIKLKFHLNTIIKRIRFDEVLKMICVMS